MPAVVVTTSERVCSLRLNRPDKLNALNTDVYRELHEQLVRLAEDPETAVVVLSGEGRSFSAGVDLGGEAVPAAATWAGRRHAVGHWQRLLDLLEAIPQVTVASLHGYCIGGAALLAVSCDLRIASDDLQVRIPELAIGIPLTWGGIPRLIREVGLPLARDLVMTGRTLDGAAALAAGFVQRLVPQGELEPATQGMVDVLLAMPSGPLAMTRTMFSAIGRDRLGAAGWADADLLGWSLAEPESREAAVRYAERLRPNR